MKKILSAILAIFISASASAQNWDRAIIVASSVGIIVGTEYSIYQSLVKRELKGWANKETGTTVQLENQCGIQTEFHLLGDYRQNYIMMGITNSSKEHVGIKFRQVKFVINGTREKYPGYSYYVADQFINPRWWTLAHIPLPNKNEFADYETLRIEVPVYRQGSDDICTIVTEFKRSKHIEAEEVSYSVFDFYLDVGPSLTQSGGIWGMDFNFYFRPNHGFGMAFQDEGIKKNRDIVSFDLHYVYRKFLSPKWYVNFEPGLGFQSLIKERNYRCRYCDQTQSTAFIVDYRLMLNYVLGHWTIAEMNVLDFMIGGGIVQQWAPSDGSRLGALVRFGLAF